MGPSPRKLGLLGCLPVDRRGDGDPECHPWSRGRAWWRSGTTGAVGPDSRHDSLYLERTLWPSGLYPIYPAYPHSLVWGTILGIAVVVGMSILAWRRRRSAPEWLFGWLWFLVCLLPVMGFVHVGRSFTSDRYTYLAHAGLAFAMVQSLTTLMEKRRNLSPSILGLLIGLVFLIGLGSRQLAGIWRDSGRLFKRGILVQPDSALELEHLGAWQTMSGDFEGGLGRSGRRSNWAPNPRPLQPRQCPALPRR
ncbi:MAG: hypothetical protein R3F31_13990 [Verrucomicrobiales bacterium]